MKIMLLLLLAGISMVIPAQAAETVDCSKAKANERCGPGAVCERGVEGGCVCTDELQNESACGE